MPTALEQPVTPGLRSSPATLHPYIYNSVSRSTLPTSDHTEYTGYDPSNSLFPTLPLLFRTSPSGPQLHPPRRTKMMPLNPLHLQPTLLHDPPDIPIPPTPIPIRVPRRQVIEDAVQPSVVTPAVLEQENPTVLPIRQRAQMAQKRSRIGRRAEAHGLQNRVIPVPRRVRHRRFSGLDQEGRVCVMRVEVYLRYGGSSISEGNRKVDPRYLGRSNSKHIPRNFALATSTISAL